MGLTSPPDARYSHQEACYRTKYRLWACAVKSVPSGGLIGRLPYKNTGRPRDGPTRPGPEGETMNDGHKPIAVRVGAPARDMPNGAELEAFSGDPHFMLSLARGLLVLQTFVNHGPRLTVSDAARATGLARATARRCLYTLE